MAVGDVSNNTPYQSVGESKQVQLGQTTSRQTFSDTIASKAVQAGGVVLNGAATIGGAIFSTLGSNGGTNLMGRLAMVGQSASVSGGNGPVSFSGPTAMGNTNTTTSPVMTGGAAVATQTGSAAALPGGPATATSGQNAFGAGAMALPGTDMGGSYGMGVGGTSAVGGATGIGGAIGGSAAVGAAAGGDSQSQMLAATKQMQETQMSFNLQYLQLQSQMQNENRSYTAVSNIMKTKHDTVKNSISNVR